MENMLNFIVAMPSEYSTPVVVEQFEDLKDAETYAGLMARTKKRKFVVYELTAEFDGTMVK